MLSPDASTIRLFLHVLGATVWVGGQIALAGLVPGLRALNPDAPRAAARRFNRIAWPAYGLLVVTGLWNLSEVDFSKSSTSYQVTVMVKIAIVAASGLAAFAHTRATSKLQLALMGALGGVTALAALFFGILLRAHG